MDGVKNWAAASAQARLTGEPAPELPASIVKAEWVVVSPLLTQLRVTTRRGGDRWFTCKLTEHHH